MTIRPRAHLASVAAYQLADLRVPEGVAPVSLAQNESAHPPSPAALDAAAAALRCAARYPDPDWTALRGALSAAHGVAAELILVGAGSMELIGALIAAYAGPGDGVLAPAHGYGLFRSAALMAGAMPQTAPEDALHVSVDALIRAVTPATRIVCVANPGNPTGTRIPRAEIRRLRDGLPGDVLLLVDEAYAEFADALDPPLFDLAPRGDTAVTRSFSKAYALAGLRVGWGVFPPAVGAETRKLLNPNNVTGPAQAAAAAALADAAHMRWIVAETAAVRTLFAEAMVAAGIAAIESHTNFVLLRFETPEEARAADAALRAEGLIGRSAAGAGLPHCLRLTIGSELEMGRAAAVLTRWRQDARR